MTDPAIDNAAPAAVTKEQEYTAERQLMLVDRILVLQNELSEWRVRDQMSHQRLSREVEEARGALHGVQQERDALRAEVNELRRSNSWRIGRAVLTPVRAARWAKARAARKMQ